MGHRPRTLPRCLYSQQIHGHPVDHSGEALGRHPDGSPEITASQTCRAKWQVAAAVPQHPLAQLLVCGDDVQVGWRLDLLAPWLTTLDGHGWPGRVSSGSGSTVSVSTVSSTSASMLLDAATTPRNSRSAASLAARRVARWGATKAI